MSRNHQPLNDTYPELVNALAAQRTSRFVIDGEVVAFQGGHTSFQRLQGRLGITNPEEAWASRIPVSYCLFDLLHLDGCSSSAAAAQQAEAVVQAANDLINRQRPDLCSRRFDGQRHGIEATADLGHGGTMVVGDVKPGRARRAVGKQLDGLVSRRHGRVNDRVVAAGLR